MVFVMMNTWCLKQVELKPQFKKRAFVGLHYVTILIFLSHLGLGLPNDINHMWMRWMKNYYKTLNINESTICSGDNQKCKFEPRHCCLFHLPIHKHKNTQTNKQTNKQTHRIRAGTGHAFQCHICNAWRERSYWYHLDLIYLNNRTLKARISK